MVNRRPVPGESVPAQRTIGLEALEYGGSVTRLAMNVRSWMLDHRGALAAGALAVMSDGALGYAAISTQSFDTTMATTHLHLEYPGPIPVGVERIVATGRAREPRATSSLAEGPVEGDDERALAFVTLRALFMPIRPEDQQAAALTSAAIVDEANVWPVPVDPGPGGGTEALAAPSSPAQRALGLHVRSATTGRVELAFAADPRFSNSNGGLHGGFGCFAGERTLDLALRCAASDPASLHLVELRAVFTRPVRADGRPTSTWAEVEHLGRRLASVHGEVLDHDGRPAVVIDGTFAS